MEKSISCDASCIGNPGTVEYKIVETDSKKIIYKSEVFEMGTNNMGEFLALVHSIALIKKNKEYSKVYSDSQTAIAWVKRKRTNSNSVEPCKKLKDMIYRAEKWLSENDISDIIIEKWNTRINGEIPADFNRK